jgi:hypothetical protein
MAWAEKHRELARGSVRVVALAAGREPGVQAPRVLADGNYLHTRYYGSGKQEDFRV